MLVLISKGQLSDRQFRDINTLLSLLFTTKLSPARCFTEKSVKNERREGQMENLKNKTGKHPLNSEQLIFHFFP